MRIGTITMWAVIVRSSRSRWIHHGTISTTKRGAIDKYLNEWRDDGPYIFRTWEYWQQKGNTCERVIVSPASEATND